MTKWNPQLIREKLIEKSKQLKIRLPQMQMLLAQERFLARLFSLEEGRFFVWKGGSLLIGEYSTLEIPRYTVDIDLLLKGTDFKNTLDILKKACATSLDDGFEFSNIEVTPMQRETPYGGDRFEIQWSMFKNNNSTPLKLDICAGDVVIPVTKNLSELSLLPDELNIAVHIYPAEFIFAEKLETLFRFGTGNTRCKDLIDLWSISKLNLEKDNLKPSVEACFKNRGKEFSFNELKNILEDAFFIKNMEKMSKANFDNLKLPPISTLSEEVLLFCQKNLN